MTPMPEPGDWHVWMDGFIDLGGAFTAFALSPIPLLLLAAVLVLGFVNFAVKVVLSRHEGDYDEDKLSQVVFTNIVQKGLPLVCLAVGYKAFALFVPLMAMLCFSLYWAYGVVILYVEGRQFARRWKRLDEPKTADSITISSARPMGPDL